MKVDSFYECALFAAIKKENFEILEIILSNQKIDGNIKSILNFKYE